jgi:hypothetical protein
MRRWGSYDCRCSDCREGSGRPRLPFQQILIGGGFSQPEVAGWIAPLLNPVSSIMTGAVIPLDGPG